MPIFALTILGVNAVSQSDKGFPIWIQMSTLDVGETQPGCARNVSDCSANNSQAMPRSPQIKMAWWPKSTPVPNVYYRRMRTLYKILVEQVLS